MFSTAATTDSPSVPPPAAPPIVAVNRITAYFGSPTGVGGGVKSGCHSFSPASSNGGCPSSFPISSSRGASPISRQNARQEQGDLGDLENERLSPSSNRVNRGANRIHHKLAVADRAVGAAYKEGAQGDDISEEGARQNGDGEKPSGSERGSPQVRPSADRLLGRTAETDEAKSTNLEIPAPRVRGTPCLVDSKTGARAALVSATTKTQQGCPTVETELTAALTEVRAALAHANTQAEKAETEATDARHGRQVAEQAVRDLQEDLKAARGQLADVVEEEKRRQEKTAERTAVIEVRRGSFV